MLYRSKRPRAAFTLVEFIVATGIISVLLTLLLSAVQKVREKANALKCMNNTRQIGVALHQYHGVNGSFPSSMRDARDRAPFLSWQARILPWLEQGPLWKESETAFEQERAFW